MKLIPIFSTVLMISFCTPSGSKDGHISKEQSIVSIKDSEDNLNKKSEINQLLDTSKEFVIIDTLKIFAKLEVKGYNIDSIIARVTLFNKGVGSYFLYKPLLPSDSLVEKTFSILDENMNKLQYLIPISKHKYLQDPNVIPLIIPEILDKNMLEIKPKEKLIFQINLAKNYNFRQSDRKAKSKWVSVSYLNLFPYIIDGRHIRVPYSRYNLKSISASVYFRVQSIDDKGNYNRIKLRLPIN